MIILGTILEMPTNRSYGRVRANDPGLTSPILLTGKAFHAGGQDPANYKIGDEIEIEIISHVYRVLERKEK